MAEEEQAGAVTEDGETGVAGDSADQGDVQPGAVTEATTSDTEQTPQEIDPKISQLISAEIEKAREEWESAGGPMGKMQSKLTKRINDLQQQLARQREAETKEAMELMESDPEAAAKRLAAQVQELTQHEQMQRYEAEMTAYVRKSLEDLGLDIEDEEASKKAAEWLPRLLEDPGQWEGAFQHDLAKLNAEKKDRELSQVKKKLEAQTEEIPKLVTQAVARALEEAGIGEVDLTPDGAGKKRDDNWRSAPPSQNIRDGIKEARAKSPSVSYRRKYEEAEAARDQAG